MCQLNRIQWSGIWAPQALCWPASVLGGQAWINTASILLHAMPHHTLEMKGR
jgi:hypothetical protein